MGMKEKIDRNTLVNVVLLCMNKAIFCACQRRSTGSNPGVDNRNIFTTAKDEFDTAVVEFLAHQFSQWIERMKKATYKELDSVMQCTLKPVGVGRWWNQDSVLLCILEILLHLFGWTGSLMLSRCVRRLRRY